MNLLPCYLHIYSFTVTFMMTIPEQLLCHQRRNASPAGGFTANAIGHRPYPQNGHRWADRLFPAGNPIWEGLT